jgi:hypothetical protein
METINIQSFEEYVNEIYSINEGNYSITYIVQEELQKLMRLGPSMYFKKDNNMFSKSDLKKSVENLPINKIEVTSNLLDHKLKGMGKWKKPSYGKYSTDFPIAIRYKREIYLLDGHHRLELAKQDGERYMEVAVKDVTEEYAD